MGRGEAGTSSLSVHVLVAVVEPVDVGRVDDQRLAELTGDVHGAAHVFAHHRRLDGSTGIDPDGERPVVLEEDGAAAVRAQRLDDGPTDRVVADAGERRDRYLSAELVG